MALVKCAECGKEVSTLAAACPSCGAPPVVSAPRPTGLAAPPIPRRRHSDSDAKTPPRSGYGPAVRMLAFGGLVVTAILVENSNSSSVAPANQTSAASVPSSPPVQAAHQSTPRPSTQEELCESDWGKCADNEQLVGHYKGWTRVRAACQVEANALAKYGTPDWGGWLKPTFGTFLTGTDYVTRGVAVAIEGDAQFQNGFGAMVHSQVTCTYDLRANRVVDIEITPR